MSGSHTAGQGCRLLRQCTGNVNPDFDPNDGGIRVGSTNNVSWEGNFTLSFTQVATGWF